MFAELVAHNLSDVSDIFRDSGSVVIKTVCPLSNYVENDNSDDGNNDIQNWGRGNT